MALSPFTTPALLWCGALLLLLCHPSFSSSSASSLSTMYLGKGCKTPSLTDQQYPQQVVCAAERVELRVCGRNVADVACDGFYIDGDLHATGAMDVAGSATIVQGLDSGGPVSAGSIHSVGVIGVSGGLHDAAPAGYTCAFPYTNGFCEIDDNIREDYASWVPCVTSTATSTIQFLPLICKYDDSIGGSKWKYIY